MKSIYSVSRKSLEQYFIDKKMPKFRATQVFEGLYKQDVDNLFDIKGLKKEVMTMLNDDFYFNKLEIVEKNKADDGTTKYLFKLEDGSLIETVLMVHNYGYSVCVSTQVGCNMGCSFCASGEVKKIRNLTPDEMLLQVKVINDDLKKQELRVTNVVMMGIGEPFDNFENVLEFIRIINDDRGLEIGARHITVSTCGIAPKIIEFANFPYQVNLAISLHFATNIKRSKYMKINNTYSLESIIEALKFYYQKTNRRITFEYIMLKGINDSIEDAEELAKLVSQFNCYINLIPYNDTDNKFKRSDDEQVRKFFDHLKKKNLNVTRRREQGSEIAAACGQLRVNKLKEKNMKGIVIKLISGDYTVRTKEEEFICKGRGVFRHQEQEIIVGDTVEIDSTTKTIIKVLPRKNRLARPSVSNVDKVFLVFSVKEPDLNFNLLDRLISYYEYLNLEIIIIFTKMDLLLDNQYQESFDYYQNLGYQIFKTSIEESKKEEILKQFDNSISVLSGQSGVGKSSLLNAIGKNLNIKTDKISYALNRGKHTTRHVELLEISKGLVADTPGFGTIDFEEISEATLSQTFIEFFKRSSDCRFNSCLHINEPGCAVIEDVKNNKILESRYNNYLSFIKEIREIKKYKY